MLTARKLPLIASGRGRDDHDELEKAMTDTPADIPAIEQPRPDTPAAGAKRIRLDQKANETAVEYWVRKMALATQFIAWIVGLAAAAAVILGIIAAVELAHLNSYLSGGSSGSPASNCLSQGGTDPSC